MRIWSSEWRPANGRAGAGDLRGDEERTFSHDGVEGVATVQSRTGGWLVWIYLGERVAYHTGGFGQTTKAGAKAEAARALRSIKGIVPKVKKKAPIRRRNAGPRAAR